MRFKVYLLIGMTGGLLALTVFLFVSSSTPQVIPAVSNSLARDVRAYILPLSEPNLLPILNSEVPQPDIKAKAFISYDVHAGKNLWDKNSDIKLPIASLTKVLSAVVALENVRQDEIVTVPSKALRVDKEKQTLYLNEQISVENLLKLMLIESSNDAAYALADYVEKTKNIDFAQKMNEKALSIGMYDSSFMDPAGLDDNAFSSAADLVKLIKYSLQYEKLWNFTSQNQVVVMSADNKIQHAIKNTDQLLGTIPDIIGGKTGNTDRALGCLILILDVPGGDDTIINIVLGSDDRFGDMAKIVTWVKGAYRWK